MSFFKKILAESSSKLNSEIERHMDQKYREVHAELPSHGDFHFVAAVDHVGGHAYDHFKDHPSSDKVNFLRIAKRVVNRYAHNDTKESRKKYEDIEKKHRALSSPKKQKEPKKKLSYSEKAGYTTASAPFSKPKKGIGSW